MRQRFSEVLSLGIIRSAGVINALRARGEFRGEPLETILINPKGGAIKAKSLLLIGLGSEDQLSLDLMEQVGKTALRQAKEMGATKLAFAPLWCSLSTEVWSVRKMLETVTA